MEDVHGVHRERAVGWLSALTDAVARFGRQSKGDSPRHVVTPWSGRSPGGWSA